MLSEYMKERILNEDLTVYQVKKELGSYKVREAQARLYIQVLQTSAAPVSSILTVALLTELDLCKGMQVICNDALWFMQNAVPKAKDEAASVLRRLTQE